MTIAHIFKSVVKFKVDLLNRSCVFNLMGTVLGEIFVLKIEFDRNVSLGNSTELNRFEHVNLFVVKRIEWYT